MIEKTIYEEFSEAPQNLIETVRIKGNQINVRVVIASGKEGDFFVAIAPSIMVSGYGDSEEEAQKSFDENMEVFCEDIMSLNPKERDIEFRRLGFAKERFHNKNFSKSYVDENGVLQGIEPQSLKKRVLEKVI